MNGKSARNKFVEERLVDKSKGLHCKISFKYEPANTEATLPVSKDSKIKLTTDEQENNSAVSFIQYATARGFDIKEMLTYPITTRPIYLLEENSTNQKKAVKSDLTNALLKSLNRELVIVGEDTQIPRVKTTAIVVDFMSVVRRFSSTKMDNVKSFGQFCSILLKAIVSYGHESETIHIILENYSDISIKSSERKRRTAKAMGNIQPLFCEVVSEEQRLPASFTDFFARTSNKISFQNFFVVYSSRHYLSDKPLFIAGGDSSDPDKCIKIESGTSEEAKLFRASHEEADDRLMYSINKIYESRQKGDCAITVISPDADIFVTLMYHLNTSWNGMELYVMKKGRVKCDKALQNELYPLHKLILSIGTAIINGLPAGHALTGCDSAAKIGTKISLLKALEKHGSLINEFGVDRLDEEMIDRAELFLVKIIATKVYQNCSTFDQLRTKLFMHSKEKKFIKLPCSSNEVREHIKRAYYQTRMWVEAPFGDARELMSAENYGYHIDLTPKWFSPPYRPLDVPEPCQTCTSCVRASCPCRQRNIACSSYCKCVDKCKNPLNNT